MRQLLRCKSLERLKGVSVDQLNDCLLLLNLRISTFITSCVSYLGTVRTHYSTQVDGGHSSATVPR